MSASTLWSSRYQDSSQRTNLILIYVESYFMFYTYMFDVNLPEGDESKHIGDMMS